jgi:hypothetical protein
MSLAAMRLIGFILGVFLITLAVSMVIPMITLVAYERSDDQSAFFLVEFDYLHLRSLVDRAGASRNCSASSEGHVPADYC